MQRALFTAATGMISQQQNVDVIANNVANVNTTGFKEVRANFQDLLYQRLQAAGVTATATTNVPTGIQIGLGSKLVSTQKLFTQGPLENTEQPTHLAVEGDGFFRIDLGAGIVGYTRDGTFTLDAEGKWVTPNGFYLLDAPTIPDDSVIIACSPEGVIEARDSESAVLATGTIQLTRFVNPGGLNAIGNNMYLETPASGAPVDNDANDPASGTGAIRQGWLEQSNVQVVKEMVDLIRGQRAFEINSNSIRSADQMLQVVNNLKS